VRAFLAVEVPRPDAARTDVAREHLTLRFLGEIDEPTADAIAGALGPALAPIAPFEFVVEGVGAFPTAERPRVVWRGVGRGSAELKELARVVRATVVSVGVPDDPAPFVPHVTLFRVRTPRDRERAARLLGPDADSTPRTPVPVEAVELVESELRPGGAVHRTRARVPLRGTPA
jgi:2'-5' RNA ligase